MRRRAMAWGFPVAVAALSACSLDWTLPGESAAPDGGARDASLPADAGAADAFSPPDARLLDAPPPPPPPTDAAAYECNATKPCPAGTFCHYADHLCGAGQPGGSCVQPKTGCFDDPNVCGCDGVIHNDECDANQQPTPIDVSARGSCTPPSDDYACGYAMCWKKGILPAEYCVRHTGGAEVTYECPTAPSGCDSVSCNGCTMPGCGPCQPLDAGGFMFDCP